MTTKKKTSRPATMRPYIFNDTASALAAESAVNEKFPEVYCYASEGKTLFVPEHKSLVMAFAIDDFVRSLGGRPI